MNTQSPGPGASSTQLSTPDEVFEPGFRLGRYEILRHVGAGGMGVVYQARDTVRGTVVALKTLHRMDPGALLRLKDEFRFIANVTHPNLVSLHELVAVDGRWFFTMEYIDGEDLWARLRRAVLEKANPLSPMPSNEPTRVPQDETATSVRESAQGVSATFVGGRDASATFVRGPAQDVSATFVRDSSRDATHTRAAGSGPDATVASVGNSGVHSEMADGQGSGSSPERAGRPLLPPDELRMLFRQIALAIDALHSSKKLHCDIKPRNIMIGRDGRVVLLDFGLAKNRAEPAIAELAGTPAYISPEQIAGLPASEASDWYSFGATLYEALTGRRAFTRDRLLKEKTVQEPPNLPPSPELPEDLRTLCLALLSREPSQRPKGHEVLARLGHDSGAQREPLPRAAGLVGREGHLSALWDAYTTLRTKGRTVVVHVHGLSGFGKTVLVQRFFAAIGEQRGAIVLSGRCFERESVPYKAFDPLIDSLTRYLQTLTSYQMQGLVPQHLPELLRIFPVLRQVEAFAAVEPTPMDSGRDHQELRHRAFRGLKELLLLLSRKTHMVLHIDDLHWGDQDSTLALGELLDLPDAPRMLLVCGYRTAEGEAAGLLEAHRERSAVLEEPLDVREVVLGALSDTQSRQLAALLLQAEEGDPRVSAIVREAHGSPFFIEELVQYMRTKGGPGADLASVKLEQVVLHRVAQLPEPTRRLLEVVAVAGRPVAQELAYRAAELQGDHHMPWTVLRAGNLVRTRGAREDDPAECYHDRIRESVYANLAPAALAAHHLKLATLLEASGAEPEVLALHFRGAGVREKAGRYAALAGDHAAEALAFERAAKLYREALESSPGDAELVEKQADALVNAGRCAEAAPLYLEAAKSAAAEKALELRRRAAEQYLSSGCIPEGVAVLKPVVSDVGLTYPASPPEALQGIIDQSIQLATRGYQVVEAPPGSASPQLLSQVDAAWSASKGLGSVDILRGGYFSLRSTLLALDAGDPLRAARGLAALGVVMVCRAAPADVEAGNQMFAEVARILDAGKGDDQLAGQYRVFRGMSEMGLGHWRLADQLLMEGNDLLEEHCTGCAWELSQAHVCDVYSLVQLGELREAASRGSRWLRGAQEIGDLYGKTSLEIHLTAPTLAADQGDAAAAQLQETVSGWSKEQFTPQHLLAVTDAAKCELYRGNPEAAWSVIDGAWKAAEHSMGWQFTRVMAFYFHAGAAVALARQQPAEREKLLAVARQDAQVVYQEGRHYARGVAGVLRAGIAMTEGQSEEALRQLDEAIAGFTEAEMALHAACARRRKGELLGGDPGQALIAEADAAMEAQGIRRPLQWADMYAPGFRSS